MRIARFEIVPTLTPRQLFERLELAIAASAPEVSRASASQRPSGTRGACHLASSRCS